MEAAQAGISGRFSFLFLFQLGKSFTERGFRSIHPPSIHAHIIKSFLQVLPKDIPSGGVICVKDFIARPCRFVKQCTNGIQRVINIRFRSESGPYGKHEMYIILLMQLVNNLPGIVKMKRIEGETVPMEFVAPIFPILHNIIQRDSPSAVFFYDCFQFIERFISFFGLPETIHPFPEHRNVSCQFPVTGNNFIHAPAIHEIIIGSIAHFGHKGVAFVRIFKLCRGIVIP